MDNNTQSRSLPYGRLWDWPAALLLAGALLTASRRLIVTEWTLHLRPVQTITFLAIIAGLALGYSRFNTRRSINFMFGYGLFTIVWQLGLTMDNSIAWLERLNSLLGRAMITIAQLTSAKYVTDPLLFLFLMYALFWILAITASYGLTRSGNPWQAIIPPGIAMVIIHTYDPLLQIRAWFLAVYLLFGLMIVARLYYLQRQTIWQRQRTHVPLYTGVDMLRATLFASVLLVLMAWLAPAFARGLDPAERAWQKLTAPWTEIRDDIGKAFTSLQASVGVINDYYGESLPLGRGNSLGDQVIFTAETPLRPTANIRFYWRARAYDYYDPFGRGWEVTVPNEQPVSPDRVGLEFPQHDARWRTTINVTTGIPLSIMYVATSPEWVSRPANLRLDFSPEGLADIAYIRAEEPLMAGETYQFEAAVTAASVRQLYAADGAYPAWVLERYLQLPEASPTARLPWPKRSLPGWKTPTRWPQQSPTGCVKTSLTQKLYRRCPSAKTRSIGCCLIFNPVFATITPPPK